MIKGFAPIMPKVDLPVDELDALVAYIKSQGAGAPAPTVEKAQR